MHEREDEETGVVISWIAVRHSGTCEHDIHTRHSFHYSLEGVIWLCDLFAVTVHGVYWVVWDSCILSTVIYLSQCSGVCTCIITNTAPSARWVSVVCEEVTWCCVEQSLEHVMGDSGATKQVKWGPGSWLQAVIQCDGVVQRTASWRSYGLRLLTTRDCVCSHWVT